jgi:hypothetical protein
MALPLVALLLAARAATAGAADRVARFAIVIGNNRPEAAGVPSLRYADDDAVATHALLLAAGVESVLLARLDEDSRRLHPAVTPAGAPRGDDLDRAFTALSARMQERAARGDTVELLLFYSGHGDVAAGEGYVVLEDRRLTRSALHALLARSPAARNHVFIDACKSYFLAFERGPGGTREAYARSFVADTIPAHLRNTGFVLSTSSGRDSHEWERYQAGILSHEVRSALRGAADTDGDGRVTYAELGAFLAAANQSIENERFRPDFLVRPPGQDLGQAVLGWAAARGGPPLRVEGGGVGHLYIETARGERLLDAHPAAGQPLLLHLPGERPLFVRRSDESAEEVVTESAPPPITALPPVPPAVAMRGALHLAFEQLFASPFGAADVRDFARRFRMADLAPVPPQPSLVATADLAPAPGRGRSVQRVAASVALGGVAAGLTLSALALSTYAGGAGASQVDIARRNATVVRLDLAAAGCFAVAAAAAGATWGFHRWRASLVPSSDGGVAVGLAGRY